MARRGHRRQDQRRRGAPGWERLAGVLVTAAAFASQTAVLAQAQSPFRLTKWSLAGGLALAGAMAAVVGAAGSARLRMPVSRLLGVAVGLPLAMAVSAAWSDAPSVSLRTAAWAGAMVLVATAAALLGGEWRRRAAWGVVWGAEISAVVGLWQALGLDPLGIAPVAPGARFHVTGLAGNPADLAAGSLLAVAVLAWLLESGGGRRLRLLAGPPVLAAVASRTLTGLAALGALALVLGFRLVPRRRQVVALAAAGVVVAGALAVSLPRLEEAVRRVERGDWYMVLSARGDGWSAAAEMIREHPLAGVGAGRYSCRFAPARLAWLEAHGEIGARGELATHFQWAHCDPLQLGAELGVLGWLWPITLVWALAAPEVRRHPLVLPALAVVVPFALLHYPFHLGLMVLPLAVVGGELAAAEAGDRGWTPRAEVAWALAAAAAGVLGLGIWMGSTWLRVDRWVGTAEARLSAAGGVPVTSRTALLLPVEREALARIEAGSFDAARLWRIVGRCRLGRGAPAEAEKAFRRAMESCPHEEAWVGLGLALAAQGRRSEGLLWLVRAARINPALIKVIPEGPLRESVRGAIARDRPRHGSGNSAARSGGEDGPRGAV